MELLEIIDPVGGCDLGMQNVTILLRNNASQVLDTMSVGYHMPGHTPVIENMTNASLAPGDSMLHTFATQIDLSTTSDTSFTLFEEACSSSFINLFQFSNSFFIVLVFS